MRIASSFVQIMIVMLCLTTCATRNSDDVARRPSSTTDFQSLILALEDLEKAGAFEIENKRFVSNDVPTVVFLKETHGSNFIMNLRRIVAITRLDSGFVVGLEGLDSQAPKKVLLDEESMLERARDALTVSCDYDDPKPGGRFADQSIVTIQKLYCHVLPELEKAKQDETVGIVGGSSGGGTEHRKAGYMRAIYESESTDGREAVRHFGTKHYLVEMFLPQREEDDRTDLAVHRRWAHLPGDKPMVLTHALKQFATHLRENSPGLPYLKPLEKRSIRWVGIETLAFDRKAYEYVLSFEFSVELGMLRHNLIVYENAYTHMVGEFKKVLKEMENRGSITSAESEERLRQLQKQLGNSVSAFVTEFRTLASTIEKDVNTWASQFDEPIAKQLTPTIDFSNNSWMKTVKLPLESFHQVVSLPRTQAWIDNAAKHQRMLIVGGASHANDFFDLSKGKLNVVILNTP